MPIVAVSDMMQDYPGIAEMVAGQWKDGLGVNTQVSAMARTLMITKVKTHEVPIVIWESTSGGAVPIYPPLFVPSRPFNYIDTMAGLWWGDHSTGREPVSEFILKQFDLMREVLSSSDPAVFARNNQAMVEQNCKMANPVTTVSGTPAFTGIIKRNLHNVPNPLPYSVHALSPGNGFAETWWIEE